MSNILEQRRKQQQTVADKSLDGEGVEIMRRRYRAMGHPDDGGAYMLKGKLDG